MAEKWLYLYTEEKTPAYNMALDECLLRWHSKGEIPPVLRFYTWKPYGLSLGYFQKSKGKIDVEAAKKHGFGLVRRLTGGRAVLHAEELTYSVIVSEKHEKMPKTVTEAYRVISEGLLEGFRALGLDANFSIPEGKIGQTGSAVCFDESSWYELVVEGRKAAGSAQTRKRGVILQHGSIPLELDEDLLFDMFIYPSDRVKEKARKAFSNKAIAINDISDRKFTISQLVDAFYNGFEKGLNIELEPLTLSQAQVEEVEELEKSKYNNDEWTYSR